MVLTLTGLSADWCRTKKVSAPVGGPSAGSAKLETQLTVMEETIMKIWSKPAVREQEVGLEVTSYLPAEIDVI